MAEEKRTVTITYESLYELLRREKDREELQKLDSSFFQDVTSYVDEKKQSIEKTEGQTALFSAEEKVKTARLLQNIRKIIRDLYERREHKILRMAVDKSRLKSSLIDTSALLLEEKGLFEHLVALLDRYRQGIIEPLGEGKMPMIAEQTEAAAEAPKVTLKKEAFTKLVRFLHAVPKFVGKELEEYGPFEEEDIASLPVEIADVLIKKGRVEELHES